MIKLSVLDQSPISDGSTAAKAFSHTVTLAQEVEKSDIHAFGYQNITIL